MNFALIRETLLYKIKDEIFSYEDATIFISDLVKTFGIQDYLRKIKFLPNKSNEALIIYSLEDEKFKKEAYADHNPIDILSTYNFYDKTIKLDMNNILNEAYELFDNDEELLALFINMNIIECMIHECVHVYQNFVIHETDYGLYNLMALELSEFENMNENDYNKFYNIFMFEREAIITTYEALMVFAKKIFHNENIFEYYKDCLTTVLLGGYKIKRSHKITSPLEIKFKDLFKREMPEVSALDIYEALKFGLPVSYNDYVKFQKNNRELILAKTSCNRK